MGWLSAGLLAWFCALVLGTAGVIGAQNWGPKTPDFRLRCAAAGLQRPVSNSGPDRDQLSRLCVSVGASWGWDGFRERYFQRSRRGSPSRTAQEAVGAIRHIFHRAVRAHRRGRRGLARLSMVGSQAGCPSGCRFRAGRGPCRGWQARGGGNRLRQARHRRYGRLSRLGRLRQATELARTDPKAAVAAYDQITADKNAGQAIQDLAAVRAGFLLVDGTSYAEMRARLEPLTAADRTFRHSAREILALSAWKSGDLTAARQWTDLIIADPQTPSGTRSRAEVLSELITAASSKG